MASQYGYSTISEISNYLLVTIDSSLNTQVDSWISAAEHYVNNFTGYTTASGMALENVVNEISEAHVDGDQNLVIHPRKSPVTTVSGITIIKGSIINIQLNLTNPANGTNRYVLPTQGRYIVYPSYELTITSSTILHNFINVKYSRFFTQTSYQGGYATIPQDVTLATTMIASDIVMRHANKEGLMAITQGKISKKWAELKDGKSNWIQAAENLLIAYKMGSNWW